MHSYELHQAPSATASGRPHYARPVRAPIYPGSRSLEEEGLVTRVSSDGRRAVYAITGDARPGRAGRPGGRPRAGGGRPHRLRAPASPTRSAHPSATGCRALRAELAAAAHYAKALSPAKQGATAKGRVRRRHGAEPREPAAGGATLNEVQSSLRSGELREIQV